MTSIYTHHWVSHTCSVSSNANTHRGIELYHVTLVTVIGENNGILIVPNFRHGGLGRHPRYVPSLPTLFPENNFEDFQILKTLAQMLTIDL